MRKKRSKEELLELVQWMRDDLIEIAWERMLAEKEDMKNGNETKATHSTGTIT